VTAELVGVLAIAGRMNHVVERELKVDKALKSWLDNVLVPALVRQYLAAARDVVHNGLSANPSHDSDPSKPENIQ
jgi:hypothetical protein